MKKSIAAILAVVMLVTMLVCMVEIRDLRRQVHFLQTAVDRYEADLEQRFSGMENRVENKIESLIEQQEKAFYQVDWEFGPVDWAKRQVAFLVTAIPKEYAPESSQAWVRVNGETVPMELQNGIYQAKLPMDLSGDYHLEEISLETNGTVSSQRLELVLSPAEFVLPQMDVIVTGADSGSTRSGVFNWQCVYNVELYADAGVPFSVESLRITEVLDEKEIGSEEVDLSDKAQQAYRQQSLDANCAVPEEQVVPSAPYESQWTERKFYYHLDKTYEIPSGSELILLVEMTDGNGNVYRGFVGGCEVDDDAHETGKWDQPFACEDYRDSFYEILDANGNLIYTKS